MIKKGLYHKVYAARVEAAVSACETIASLTHSGEKGRIRELLIGSLFRPLLPADLGIGTGFVVAASGQISGQQDIVLYDRSTLPPAMFDDTTGLFPIESVLYSIEVKSTLTRDELSGAHASAKALGGLPRLDGSSQPAMTGPRPCSALFALASDLSPDGKSEIQRYDEVRGADPPWISTICVARRGYWWLTAQEFRAWPERGGLAETIGFLAGILNSVPAEYAARRAARPALGAYLIDFGNDFSEALTAINALAARVQSFSAEPIRIPKMAAVLISEILASKQQFNDALAQYAPGTLPSGADLEQLVLTHIEQMLRELRANS